MEAQRINPPYILWKNGEKLGIPQIEIAIIIFSNSKFLINI